MPQPEFPQAPLVFPFKKTTFAHTKKDVLNREEGNRVASGEGTSAERVEPERDANAVVVISATTCKEGFRTQLAAAHNGEHSEVSTFGDQVLHLGVFTVATKTALHQTAPGGRLHAP